MILWHCRDGWWSGWLWCCRWTLSWNNCILWTPSQWILNQTVKMRLKWLCMTDSYFQKRWKSIAAFNVESTDVTKRHLWFCNWKRALQESGDQLYTITDSWCYFNQQLQCQEKLVTSYSTFIYIHYEVSLDFPARSVVQVKKWQKGDCVHVDAASSAC